MEAGFAFCTLDFSRISTEAEAKAAFAEAKRVVATAAPKSLRVLTDVTGSRMSTSIISGLTDLARHNEPYVAKSAVIGLSLVHRVAIRQIVRLTNRDLREFSSREDAMAYLLQP